MKKNRGSGRSQELNKAVVFLQKIVGKTELIPSASSRQARRWALDVVVMALSKIFMSVVLLPGARIAKKSWEIPTKTA